MTTTSSFRPPTTACTAARPASGAVAVAIDGSTQDRPALMWAAQEASQLGRPLLITHAAGHLPVDLGYAARHVARRERQEAGRRVVDAAARWVARQVPGLTIEASVRLLDPAALLQSVGDRASVMTRTATSWGDDDHGHRQGPVIVALGDADEDEGVLAYATDYARRRDVELLVVEDGRRDDYRGLADRAGAGSLALVARPHPPHEAGGTTSGGDHEQGWRAALAMLTRADTPVALVSGSRAVST